MDMAAFGHISQQVLEGQQVGKLRVAVCWCQFDTLTSFPNY